VNVQLKQLHGYEKEGADLKTLTVVSGKGGTGKTSIVGSFAALAKNAVLADCDVDAANLSLIVDGQVQTSREFKASQVACIDVTKCIECGACEDICHFDAIQDYKVDNISCEGCRVCSFVCPQEAITMEEVLSGNLFISDTPYGPLVHAQLQPGEANSGKLVTFVRQMAEQIARENGYQCIVVDGPPGIGCPVIASLTGATAALVVTEPTLSAIHDLERVLSVCDHFNVPAFACINRCDIHEGNTHHLVEFCQTRDIEIIGMIPYDPTVVRAIVDQTPVVRYADGPASREIKALWGRFAKKAGLLLH
jgi:MinD superfamily P-loop ATPase